MSARDDLVAAIAELREIAADIAKADIDGFGNAITAQAERLEALLALLDAEPVAWGLPDSRPMHRHRLMQVTLQVPSNDQYQGQLWIPLYARPEASPTSVQEFVKSDDATRERIGDPVAKRAFERQEASDD